MGFTKGLRIKGRPKGTKSVMRTPEEKEQIILEYKNSNKGYREVLEKYDISESTFRRWNNEYLNFGIEGLKSKTGKHKNPNIGKYNRHPSKEEKLKREIVKLEIEVARLKKGYMVKGVGAKKEYVTTFEENTK